MSHGIMLGHAMSLQIYCSNPKWALGFTPIGFVLHLNSRRDNNSDIIMTFFIVPVGCRPGEPITLDQIIKSRHNLVYFNLNGH